jgi:hypothetical protein
MAMQRRVVHTHKAIEDREVKQLHCARKIDDAKLCDNGESYMARVEQDIIEELARHIANYLEYEEIMDPTSFDRILRATIRILV